ncbi:hypothetical protein [Hyphomicrobium sp. MC1]|uniref:hypothetical protein n=1 Tax=Hyphomicrobium sp. (strain MC1) TaxID=717785 RepID=UPI0002F547C2|nr:hypothetical protein [Hyphomicrobium sp. MC1]
MTNIIDFKDAKGEALMRQAEQLFAAMRSASQQKIAVVAGLGFIIKEDGKDVWGASVYSLTYGDHTLVDGSAELVADEVLDLVDELLRFCVSPSEYAAHAQEYAECSARHHAAVDARIKADWGIEPDAA